jgi:hypothetical protein
MASAPDDHALVDAWQRGDKHAARTEPADQSQRPDAQRLVRDVE